MALDYDSLFSALGKYVGFLDTLRSVAVDTIPANLTAIEEEFSALSGEYIRIMSGVQSQTHGFSDNIIVMCNTIKARCDALLADREIVLSQLNIPNSSSLLAVLAELSRDMVTHSQHLKRSVVTVGTVTADGTPVGTGAVYITKVLDGVSVPVVGAMALKELLGADSELSVDSETMWAQCLSEGEAIEQFSVGGGQANSGGFDWRSDGSGGPITVQVANAAAIVTGRDLTTYLSGVPTGWTLGAGTLPGTHIFEQTAGVNVFRGSGSLRIAGNGVLDPIRLYQPLVLGQLVAGKSYALGIAVKATAATTGTLLVQLGGTGYTPGTLEKISVDLSTASTSWELEHCFVNLPLDLPDDLYIEIKVTGPMTNAKDVWVDSLSFAPTSWFGGLGVAIVEGATPFVRGDRWTWPVDNDNAGKFGTFFRRGYKLQLPSGVSASTDLDDTKAGGTGIVIPPPDVDIPADLTELALWIDAADATTVTTRQAPSFAGGNGNINYLSCADHADFDFSSGQFTVIFSRNQTVNPLDVGNIGATRTFIGQNRDIAGGGGWCIKCSDASLKESTVGLFISLDSAGATFATRTTNNTFLNGSRYAITYNQGSMGIYVDTVLQAGMVDVGVMPATLFNPTTIPFTIGREGHSAYRDAFDLLYDVRVYQNRVLSSGNIVEDYNSGNTKRFADLSPGLKTGCVAAWDLDGDLVDKTGRGHDLAVVGSVPYEKIIVGLADKSPAGVGVTMYPRSVNNAAVLGDGFGPRYNPSGINSLPTIDVKYNHSLYSNFPQAFDTPTIDIAEVIRITAAPAGEFFTINSADEGSDNYYFMPGYSPHDFGAGSITAPALRVQNDSSGVGSNHIFANFSILPNVNYLVCWRMLGFGGAASMVCEVNGVPVTDLDYTGGVTTVYDAGPQDVNFRDNITFNSLSRVSGNSWFGVEFRYGETCWFAPGLSDANYLLVKQYLATKWGITLP